jgi:hypothetical protein
LETWNGNKGTHTKKAMKLLTVFLSFAVAANPWIPLNWKDIPPAEPGLRPYARSRVRTTDTAKGDVIEVYYLVAPLMEEDYGNKLRYLDLFHAALGIVNLNTSFAYTINYDADEVVTSSVVPTVKTYKNGTCSIEWSNGGLWHSPTRTCTRKLFVMCVA